MLNTDCGMIASYDIALSEVTKFNFPFDFSKNVRIIHENS